MVPEDVLSPIRKVVAQMRDELDDHRQAINETTNEIQSNNSDLCKLHEKIDVLGRQLAGVVESLQSAGILRPESTAKESDVEPLTPKEKEVFRALYVLSETQTCVTYKDIARKLDMPDKLVAEHVTGMIEKGVPILKNYGVSAVFLHLDEKFRQRQARENIVGISAVLSSWIR